MTAASELPDCTNYQVLVYPADRADEFEGLTSLEGLYVAVESGSAGEDAAEALGADIVPVQAQSNTLMEVQSGNSDNAANDTTDGGDLIADLQTAAHSGILLFLLLLRTVDHEVQQDQHQCQREEQADIAFGRGSQKLHGAKSPLKNSDNAIIPSYQPCCKAKV